MYMPSDHRRIRAAFDGTMPAPYEADVIMGEGRKSIRVCVLDPDDETKTVAQAMWEFEESKLRNGKQPSDAELAEIVKAFVDICNAHAAAKAAPVEA